MNYTGLGFTNMTVDDMWTTPGQVLQDRELIEKGYVANSTMEFDPALIIADKDVFTESAVPGEPVPGKFPWLLALLGAGAYYYFNR